MVEGLVNGGEGRRGFGGDGGDGSVPSYTEGDGRRGGGVNSGWWRGEERLWSEWWMEG